MILIRAHVYARENVIRLLILIPFFIREPNETNRRCAWIAVDARNFAEFVIRGSEKQNAPSVCVFLTSRTGISISRPCVWVFLATSYDARPARASVSTRGVRASAPARALSSHPTTSTMSLIASQIAVARAGSGTPARRSWNPRQHVFARVSPRRDRRGFRGAPASARVRVGASAESATGGVSREVPTVTEMYVCLLYTSPSPRDS